MSLGALPGVQALEITGAIADATRGDRLRALQGRRRGRRRRQRLRVDLRQPVVLPNGALCVDLDRPQRAALELLELRRQAGACNVVAGPGRRRPRLPARTTSSRPSRSAPRTARASTERHAGYDFYAGTSMATPHVAGVAALLTAQGRTDRADDRRPRADRAHAGRRHARHLHAGLRLRDRRRAGGGRRAVSWVAREVPGRLLGRALSAAASAARRRGGRPRR